MGIKVSKQQNKNSTVLDTRICILTCHNSAREGLTGGQPIDFFVRKVPLTSKNGHKIIKTAKKISTVLDSVEHVF